MNISKSTYSKMKELIKEYENKKEDNTDQKPYFETITIAINLSYNPNYGDDRKCKCGHSYYRHFDTYEDMYPIGCKYCRCSKFIEKIKS